MATLFKLGSRGYHATVQEFQGQIRVHIRKYIDGEEKNKFPTKYGIALSIEEFEELFKVMGDLSEMVDVMVESCSMTTQPGDESGLLTENEYQPQARGLQPSKESRVIEQTPKHSKRPQEMNHLAPRKLFKNNRPSARMSHQNSFHYI